jgi:hypothetical protein
MRLAQLAILGCFASACAAHVAPPEVSLPNARAATCPVSPAEEPQLCASPASFTHDFQHRGLNDVLFASCDVFMSEYWIRIGTACDSAVKDLANAPLCYAGPEPCREDRAGRDEMLGNAVADHLSPECRAWSTRIAWGDAIGDASCAPGHDVAHGPITLAPDVVVSMRDVPVGAWTYAIALEPHLGELGKQYLRKFLVCQALETEAARGDEARLHRFLVTSDKPSEGSSQ